MIEIPVIRGQVLGISVYRGYAELADLARISKPDIYDQKNNPTGTQRDLSHKHAREAYEYVRNRELGYWPEVFLAIRDNSIVKYTPSEINPDIGVLRIDAEKAELINNIAISRVDGNHRLHYADGNQKGFDPIKRKSSFCLAYNLKLTEEMTLFRDINTNQRRMNTSHLDNIEARLTPEEKLKTSNPALYLSENLGKDKDSPLFNLVYEGGDKPKYFHIPLRTLKSGIVYMLSRPTKLTMLDSVDPQYRVIKNYFIALKRWQPEAWQNPSQYILLRGAGLWGVCFIGADVIDRALGKGKFGAEDMLEILKSGRNWDWSTKGDFQGYSGRGGAVKISEQVTSEFQDETGFSVKELFRQIMDE